jgi:hyaluronan synthase
MALQEVTPLPAADRALLDLARQGADDGQLGLLLGVDAAEIARRRTRLERLAGEPRVRRQAPDLPVRWPPPGAPRALVGPPLAPPHARAESVPAPAPAAPAAPAPGRAPTLADRAMRVLAGVYLLAILAAVALYKGVFLEALTDDPWFTGYGIVVSSYLVSRFALTLFYRPPRDRGHEPAVAIVMPAFNEEKVIAQALRSLLDLEYPTAKLEIVAIDDGSTDGTLAELRTVAEENPRVRVIEFPQNRGKRAAMAAGIRATSAEIVAFVDSDSVVEPDALRRLVQDFAEPRVGAVCGHADVLNANETWITRMQAVRYFVAFRVNKAAESIFNCVTCCSGCFSAYRRSAILPRLDWWERQTFLRSEATFGDDRSLTNCVMRDWKVRYASNAVSHTVAPATFRQFMRQQLRWKRSWTRESLILGRFIWKRHPIAALSTYVGVLLTLVSPMAAIHAMAWHPFALGAGLPLVYLTGMYLMAVAYGLYYVVSKRTYDPLWIWGIAFCFFYLAFLLWQTYWAILTCRSSEWGTRPATAGTAAAEPAVGGSLVLAPAEATS